MSSAAYMAGLGTGASLIIAIGAQNAFVLRQGLQRRHVSLVVAICTLSDVLLILLGVAGMGLVVQQHAGLLQWLRYVGAIFLFGYGLFAGWRAYRGTSGLQPVGDDIDGDRWRVALACFGFTLLNPHVYLDTVVLLGSVSTRYAGTMRWWFAGGAATASVVWFTALGFGARLLMPWFRSALAWRLLDAFVAVLMLMLAAVLLGAFG